MSLNPEQLSTLAQIGIPVWELRKPEPEFSRFSNDVSKAASVSLNPNSNCLLLLDNQSLSKSQEMLLVAVMRSINVELSQVTWINENQLNAIRPESGQSLVVVVCGDKSVTPINDAVTVAVIPDLATMLSQPLLKSSAWQVLQRVQSQVQLRA